MCQTAEQRDVQAIAIDFDGVLTDSQPLHLDAWRKVLKERSLNVEALKDRILGASVEEFVHSLGLDPTIANTLAIEKQETVLTLARQSPPPLYPNVRPTLHRLSQGFRLVLVTSAEPELVHIVLSHHRIDECFADLVLEQDYSRPKPDPEPYQVAVERMGVLPNQVIAVEDSPIGIQSARAAGLWTVAITNTAPLEQLNDANLVINSFEELLQLFPGG
ncbi:MAG TPA: HAD family phosphatase [Longimicrobiaceae bacterium]|nr:HAD family phosphatase [Longimicrobiaceae bacterium]